MAKIKENIRYCKNYDILLNVKPENVYVRLCDVSEELGFERKADLFSRVRLKTKVKIKKLRDGEKGGQKGFSTVTETIKCLKNNKSKFSSRVGETKLNLIIQELDYVNNEFHKNHCENLRRPKGIKNTSEVQVSFIEKEQEITLTQKELEDLIQNNVKQEVDKILEQKEKSNNSKKGWISKILKLII